MSNGKRSQLQELQCAWVGAPERLAYLKRRRALNKAKKQRQLTTSLAGQ